MTLIQIAVVAHDMLPAAEYATIGALDKALFADHPFAHHYEWAPCNAHVIARANQAIVGHADLTVRVGLLGNKEVRLVGVGTVMTAPAYRGQGIAARVLDVAERHLFEAFHADYGVLFCSDGIVPFYARRGWRVVHSPVTVEQPGRRLIWPATTMALPRPGHPWHDAPLDIRGYPW
jgi:GNAT superfamily N-acetyltransferase